MPLKVVRKGKLKLSLRGSIWYARGTMFGKPVFVSTRTTVLADAKSVAAELEKRIEEARVSHTFADAVRAYEQWGGETRYLAPLADRLGSMVLREIKQTDLDAAATAIHPNVSRETVIRQVYGPFSAVWNFAVGNDWAETRKWRRPRKPKGTLSVSRKPVGSYPVQYDHAAAFVAAMSPAPAMLLTALFYTGMRPIELFSLTAAEVDVEGRWITLANTKTGEPRGVPIHKFLVPLLGALINRGDIMFRTTKGQPYEPRSGGGGQLRSAIAGARKRSGIVDISLYTARHTVSTQLVINGVHPHIKDQILGHAADSMSRHYTQVPQAPLIDAIDTLPVPSAWRTLQWWDDPLKWVGKLAEGTGRRTDLGL